jgi:transposase
MKAYPLELRQRIVAAVEQQHDTIEKIAKMFSVTERYVYKLLELQRESGDLSPRPPGGGAVAKLDEERLLKLAELVAERPDATLEELRQAVNRRRRNTVSVSTIWRGLQKINFTLKKNETRK